MPIRRITSKVRRFLCVHARAISGSTDCSSHEAVIGTALNVLKVLICMVILDQFKTPQTKSHMNVNAIHVRKSPLRQLILVILM